MTANEEQVRCERLTPHLVGNPFDERKLSPLLILRQNIALLRAGKTALGLKQIRPRST